jgi:hypothetical protein
MRQDINANRSGRSAHKGGGGGQKGKPGGQSPRSRAPEQTFEEVRYIKYLIDNHIPVRVRLEDNSEVSGTIEYYDHSFIRLTREPAEPNLFIYKSEIKYLYELSA